MTKESIIKAANTVVGIERNIDQSEGEVEAFTDWEPLSPPETTESGIKCKTEALKAMIRFHEQKVAKYQEQLREHINLHNLNK